MTGLSVAAAISMSEAATAGPMKTAIDPHQGSRIERMQIEGLVIQHPCRLGVGGEQNLEAAIAEEALDAVRLDSTTEPILRFQQLKRRARAMKLDRTTKTRDSAAHNDHIIFLSHFLDRSNERLDLLERRRAGFACAPTWSVSVLERGLALSSASAASGS